MHNSQFSVFYFALMMIVNPQIFNNKFSVKTYFSWIEWNVLLNKRIHMFFIFITLFPNMYIVVWTSFDQGTLLVRWNCFQSYQCQVINIQLLMNFFWVFFQCLVLKNQFRNKTDKRCANAKAIRSYSNILIVMIDSIISEALF